MVHKWYDNRTDKYRSLEEVTKDIIQNYWIRKEKPKKKQIKANRKQEKKYRFKKKISPPIKKVLTISEHLEVNRMYREVLAFHKPKLKTMSKLLRKNFEKKLFQMIKNGKTDFRN